MASHRPLHCEPSLPGIVRLPCCQSSAAGRICRLGYAGLLLIRRRSRLALPLSIAAVILAYMWLKKYTILPDGTFLSFSYVTVGLSYIFFRVLHVLIEWGQDDERPPIGLGAYLLYLINFTTLVSGPIQRFDDFGRNVLPLDVSIVAAQFERIVIGFFKVNVLGLLLHAVQQNALAELTHPISTWNAVFAAFRLSVVYPFFLYANFSGYIDMVIALARLMRLELPENFNRPFAAASFLDFWARWHITLSTWLRTYVYNALLSALMRRFSDQRSPALSRRALLLRDLFPGGHLAWPHVGVRRVRHSSGRRRRRQ